MAWHDPDGDGAVEPPRLRRLRWLVNALTLTLIAGVIITVALLVIRLRPAPLPPLPETVALPAGERAEAVTFGAGWIALVTTDTEGIERIRVLDSLTGAERGMTEIGPIE